MNLFVICVKIAILLIYSLPVLAIIEPVLGEWDDFNGVRLGSELLHLALDTSCPVYAVNYNLLHLNCSISSKGLIQELDFFLDSHLLFKELNEHGRFYLKLRNGFIPQNRKYVFTVKKLGIVYEVLHISPTVIPKPIVIPKLSDHFWGFNSGYITILNRRRIYIPNITLPPDLSESFSKNSRFRLDVGPFVSTNFYILCYYLINENPRCRKEFMEFKNQSIILEIPDEVSQVWQYDELYLSIWEPSTILRLADVTIDTRLTVVPPASHMPPVDDYSKISVYSIDSSEAMKFYPIPGKNKEPVLATWDKLKGIKLSNDPLHIIPLNIFCPVYAISYYALLLDCPVNDTVLHDLLFTLDNSPLEAEPLHRNAGISLKLSEYVSIPEHKQYTLNVMTAGKVAGSLSFTPRFVPRPVIISELSRLGNAVQSGNITIFRTDGFYIPNFFYDGNDDANFYLSRGPAIANLGFPILTERDGYKLKQYRNESVILILKEKIDYIFFKKTGSYESEDYYLSVWSNTKNITLGSVKLPKRALVPPKHFFQKLRDYSKMAMVKSTDGCEVFKFGPIPEIYNQLFPAINETWLGDRLDAEVNIEGDSLFRQDRQREKQSRRDRKNEGVHTWPIYLEDLMAIRKFSNDATDLTSCVMSASSLKICVSLYLVSMLWLKYRLL